MTLICAFSNYTCSSFPNLILFRLANYWLVLISDFTVSGLLKIKLISSICFHRIHPKILVFQSLTNHLTPFSLVWGHEINHSKQLILFIAQKRSFLPQVKGESFHLGITTRFSWTYILCDVWNLALPVAIPRHNTKTYWLKNSHSWYHLNILGRNSAGKSHSKGPNSAKVITRRQICLPSL